MMRSTSRRRDWRALVQTRHLSQRFLLEVDLVALPGHVAKESLAGGGPASVVVSDAATLSMRSGLRWRL